jgi:hypothetical protein
MRMKLLTSMSTKIDKSQNDEYLNAILYLEPSYNTKVCIAASAGCRASCLVNSGRMRMQNAVDARYKRTNFLFANRDAFMAQLQAEIVVMLRKAQKQNKKLAIRLNGTSDLDWSTMYRQFPEIQFYEYTKRPDLALKMATFENVHFTFSYTERTKDETMQKMLDRGHNVAVVFKDKVPSMFKGIPVIDGDKHDRRFEDDKGRIVGLKLKGTNAIKALAIESGFAN